MWRDSTTHFSVQIFEIYIHHRHQIDLVKRKKILRNFVHYLLMWANLFTLLLLNANREIRMTSGETNELFCACLCVRLTWNEKWSNEIK